MSSVASSLSSGKRSKAEELALRRAQLERRAARQRERQQQNNMRLEDSADRVLATASDLLGQSRPKEHQRVPGPSPVARTASYEEAERAAREEARAERAAKEEAEQRANEMALRALEAERTKRIEAEKLLELERAHSAELLKKIRIKDRRKYERVQAAIVIQARWRGYWIRESLLGGKEELERRATTLQSCFRGFKARKEVQEKKRMTEAERLQNEYLRERREQKRTQSLRPTGDQQVFTFDDESLTAPLLGAIQMELDQDLLVGGVNRGGPADAQGIQRGMRLVSINGHSLLGETLDDTNLQLDGATKPWKLVLERMAGKDDTGRTLFQLVQQIKKDFGLDEGLSVTEAVDTACSELHMVSGGSLKAKVLALCVQLHIDMAAERVE